MAQHINKRGLDLIKKSEGVRLVAYKPVPTEKYYTIGYGHFGPDVHKGQRITLARAEQLLRKDLLKFEVGVEKLLLRPTNSNRFSALVSLAYNIGLGNFARSKVLAEHNKRHPLRAAKAFGAWVYGDPRKPPLKGLIVRRARERRLYLRPVVPRPKKR